MEITYLRSRENWKSISVSGRANTGSSNVTGTQTVVACFHVRQMEKDFGILLLKERNAV